MTRDLSRLFRPKSIAVIGGGAWCRIVVEQCRKMGYDSEVWPVHPRASDIAGIRAYPALEDLPGAPDATFIGINRHATIAAVGILSAMGAGGAVCFASGFAEAEAEDASGRDLERQLLEAAGGMPVLGPNCYGLINYLDGALLWPDQHGGARVETGVAIVTQSSNILINLTMQQRGLPVAYVVAAGNQAQTGFAEIGAALLDDPRVTALGLHIEGFGDVASFEALARKAAHLGKPIVALKVGKSVQAQAATISHTASLAGSDAGAAALLARFAIPRVSSLPEFLETLKLLHVTGPLATNRIASISCSGGEASLIADTAVGRDLDFPRLNEQQKADLRAALGPMVALANPLDYHTYIWRDTDKMTAAWAAMMDASIALTFLIVDFPRPDRCDPSDWACTIQAALGAKAQTGGNVAMVTTLPELLPEDVAARLMAGGVVPMHGLAEAIAAAEAAAFAATAKARIEGLDTLLSAHGARYAETLSEAEGKVRLSTAGLRVPKAGRATSPHDAAQAAERIGYPVVLKGEGIAHKTEAGAVALNLSNHDGVKVAAEKMPTQSFLVEEMVTGAVAELLVGVVRDPAHGFVLTLGAGGVMTEILKDTASLLIPSRAQDIEAALDTLKIAPLLNGYRGKPAADRAAIVTAVLAVQDYVIAHAATLEEVEVNPLLCTPERAVAADVLIREERE